MAILKRTSKTTGKAAWQVLIDGHSPAEAGPLTDLVRSARPADHPARYGPVTIAERDALIAGVAREVARRNQARASSS